MAWPFQKISDEVVKRAVEEMSQSAIEEGIRAGEDTNSLTKRVYKLALGNNSALVQVARKVPGFRFAPNVMLALAAEWLKNNADRLFQGDNRAAIQGLRLALKTSAPMLTGFGDAAADVLEKQVGASVDRAVSPASAVSKKADIDRVVVVPTFFSMRPFFPVIVDDNGAVVEVEIDGYKVPKVLDATFVTFRDNWLREHPIKKVSQGGGKGQPPRVESVSAFMPWHVYSLQEYITLIGRHGGVSESVLADLERRFRPASAGKEYSEDTWAVFRAVVCTQRHFTDLKQRDQLDRQDFESLIEKFLKSGVPVNRADEMIGKAFASRIDKETGLLTLVGLRDFETTVDVFLCGEQGMFTTIQRRWRELRHEGYAQGDATWWLSLGVIGFTAPIWAPFCLVSFLLLVAVYMAVAGVFTPLEGTQTLFGNEISGKSYAFWMAFASGWLAFATTWIFSILQTLLAWIRNFFPSLKPDWLVSLGRRISGFGLTVISGMISASILLFGASWEDRVLILAATGFTMGMAYVLVEAGWKYHVERSVLKASPWLNAVFGAGLLAYAFAHPVFVGHPDEASAAVSILGSAKDAIAHSKWLQLGAVLVGMLGVSALVSFVEYRKVQSGAYRLRIRGVGLLLTLIVLSFIGHIFFDSPGKTGLKREETTQEVSTASKQRRSEEQESPAPQGAIDMEVFCAQELSFETRQEYCQKEVGR